MASIHESSNHLEEELSRQKVLIIMYWATFVFITLWKHDNILLASSFFLCGVLSYSSIRSFSVVHSGVQGEKTASYELSQFPSSYHVFSQIAISHEGRSSETDHILVGPKGIFVIEVKNHKGTITGKEHYQTWTQWKTTSQGHTCRNPFYNPVKQVSTHTWRLSRYLRDQGINSWVQGVVLFTNPSCTLSVQTQRTPVLHIDNLSSFFNSYTPKRELSSTDIENICHTLKNLTN